MAPFFGMDERGWHCLNTIFMINPHTECPHFLLGVLNSKLLRYLWIEKFYDKRGTFPKIKGTYLKLLPVKIDDKKISEQLSELVTQMLEAKKQEAAAGNDVKRDFWTRKAQGLDRQIDTLVYELYGLTPGEIDLVEGNAPAGKEPADD